MSATIDVDAAVSTMINVFTTTPETQQQVLDILIEATEKHIAQRPGFRSASFHASSDGLRVVNYAQWADDDSWKGMLADPGCRGHITRVEELAQADYHLYHVVSQHIPQA